MSDSSEITIYTSEYCPQCKALKEYLNGHKIAFVEKQITAEILTDLLINNHFDNELPIIRIGKKYYSYKDYISM
jgi:glutaredoxin